MAGEEIPRERGAVGRMVFDASLAIVVAATGYYVSGIATDLKELKGVDIELRREISLVRERQPIDYVRKEEYRSDVADIKRILERIETNVARKQDRSISPGIAWKEDRNTR